MIFFSFNRALAYISNGATARVGTRESSSSAFRYAVARKKREGGMSTEEVEEGK